MTAREFIQRCGTLSDAGLDAHLVVSGVHDCERGYPLEIAVVATRVLLRPAGSVAGVYVDPVTGTKLHPAAVILEVS